MIYIVLGFFIPFSPYCRGKIREDIRLKNIIHDSFIANPPEVSQHFQRYYSFIMTTIIQFLTKEFNMFSPPQNS